MSEIDNSIKKLDIKDDLKSLLSSCISAEIFNIERLYNPEITISKYTQPNDERVWCEVSLVIDSKDISLFQCRPFIDRGATMKALDNKVFIRKTYYLYSTQ